MSVTASLAAYVLCRAFRRSDKDGEPADLTEKVVQSLPDTLDKLVNWVENRYTDHSGALPKALDRANNRAWQAFGLALAGEGLFDKVKDLFRDRDLTGLRDQLKQFLSNTATGIEATPDILRVRACDEFTRLRQTGRLSQPPDLLALTVGLRRYANMAEVVTGAEQVVAATADSLSPDAPHLAQVLKLAPHGGVPLLATAFVFFFRREVETNDELARSLTLDSLRQLTATQDRGFSLLLGRTEGILDQFSILFDELGKWFAAADVKLDDIRVKLDELLEARHVATRTDQPLKMSVTNEKELSQLKLWRDELRKLPPGLVESADWSKLGDALTAGKLLPEARQAHEIAAANAKAIQDRGAEAEAAYKEYRVACEQEHWEDALRCLTRAAELDPARFAPFPFNRYEPVRVLGAGGFGTVTLCRERLNKNREVAVKALHMSDIGRSLEELFGEAHTVSELNAPGIVKVIHWNFADPADTRPYLVMEYFPGVSLASHLKRHGPLKFSDFIVIAQNVSAAMAAAHKARVIHRDLKPGNLLIRTGGSGSWDVRVIDFGLAVKSTTLTESMSTSLPHRTRRDHAFAGTLEYASPEQKGLISAPVSQRSDVYSFGKTMLEALLGNYEPVADDDWDLVPERYRASLRQILGKCINKEPDRRYPGFEPITEAIAALGPTQPPIPIVQKPTNTPRKQIDPPRPSQPVMIHCRKCQKPFRANRESLVCGELAPDTHECPSCGTTAVVGRDLAIAIAQEREIIRNNAGKPAKPSSPQPAHRESPLSSGDSRRCPKCGKPIPANSESTECQACDISNESESQELRDALVEADASLRRLYAPSPLEGAVACLSLILLIGATLFTLISANTTNNDNRLSSVKFAIYFWTGVISSLTGWILAYKRRRKIRREQQNSLAKIIAKVVDNQPNALRKMNLEQNRNNSELLWDLVQYLDDFILSRKVSIILHLPGKWVIVDTPVKIFVNQRYVGDGSIWQGCRLNVDLSLGSHLLHIEVKGRRYGRLLFHCPRLGRYEIAIQYPGWNIQSLTIKNTYLR